MSVTWCECTISCFYEILVFTMYNSTSDAPYVSTFEGVVSTYKTTRYDNPSASEVTHLYFCMVLNSNI
jgi:hypothetical protein